MHKLIKILSLFFPVSFIFKILINKKLIIFNYHEINEKPSDFCIDHNLNVFPGNFTAYFNDRFVVINFIFLAKHYSH